MQLVSKLPRRASQQPSVAELVKRYQEYLPAQGVEDLAKTALAPTVPVSESEQEGMPVRYTRPRVRSKGRSQMLSKKSSISDFESSYAANIAPKYLTHTRRSLGQSAHNSRIPGPVAYPAESYSASRRTSPDKRPPVSRLPTDSTIRGRVSSSGTIATKGRGKSITRSNAKDDKPRAPRSTNVRRPVGTGKVTNITKHFERINRENERANRRYAVIRGRRARPVATARAKVEILESIKDAINDEEETDGSDSSEADDEGGDEDDKHPVESIRGGTPSALHATPSEIPSEPDVQTNIQDRGQASGEVVPAPVFQPPQDDQLLRPPTPMESQQQTSLPSSPALLPLPTTPAASPPVELDLGSAGPERVSILKTLAGLWPQQTQPSRFIDSDDPMSDPEHIFRDSSMVVRTDEPTSIIALALK